VERVVCIESYMVQYIGTQGWQRPGGNPSAVALGALAPQTAPMDWAKYSRTR
jgi:hypothetical protein